MTLTMYDSIYVDKIPASGMDAVAGYVGGKWPTYNTLVQRFPNLPALSIAVFASQDAQCLDVETGDATPSQVPGWLDWQAKIHPERTPILYCSASLIPAVRKAAGSRKYLLWAAHYNGQAHVCGSCGYPQADATQWADKGPAGETVDQTVMTPAFLAAFAPQEEAMTPDDQAWIEGRLDAHDKFVLDNLKATLGRQVLAAIQAMATGLDPTVQKAVADALAAKYDATVTLTPKP